MNVEHVEDLIWQLDNKPETMTFQLSDGFMLWPKIRYKLYKLLLAQGKSNISSDTISGRMSHLKGMKKWIDSINNIRNYFLFNGGDFNGILFNSSHVVLNNGEVRSKVHHFLNLVPNLQLLDVHYNIPRINRIDGFQSNTTGDVLFAIANLRSRVKFGRTNRMTSDEIAISRFTEFLRNNIGREEWVNSVLRRIQNELLNYSRVHYELKRVLIDWFDKVSCKFIVIEDGNYGGAEKPLLISIAKARGIVTMEVQHGVFDIAFNYGTELLKNDSFRSYKTDVLLTFGKYWSKYVNVSSRVYELGNPYLSLINDFDYDLDQDKKHIMFISQGSDTENLVDIAVRLSHLISDDYLIIYKCHPNERQNRDRYTNLFAGLKIKVSFDNNIYSLLKHVDSVIGSYSTVLFEALYFDCNIFIHKNALSDKFIPIELGVRFTNAEDLILGFRDSQKDQELINLFWEKDWKSNLEYIRKKESLW